MIDIKEFEKYINERIEEKFKIDIGECSVAITPYTKGNESGYIITSRYKNKRGKEKIRYLTKMYSLTTTKENKEILVLKDFRFNAINFLYSLLREPDDYIILIEFKNDFELEGLVECGIVRVPIKIEGKNMVNLRRCHDE